MKLLELLHNRRDSLGNPSMAMATDSAIITRGRPVFLPDFAERWSVRVAPAFRISRLGKSIPARFAHRYIDAVTLAARLIPETSGALDLDPCSPWLTAFDGAFALGKWIELPAERSRDEEIPFSIVAPQNETSSFRLYSADDAIRLISRTFTIKSGDIIIPPCRNIDFPVEINTHVEAAIDNLTILSYNIK